MSRFDRLQRAFAKADFWDSSTGGVGGHSRGGPGNSSGFDGNSSYGSNFDATSPGWGYGPTRGELGAGPAGDSSGDIGLMSFAERMIKNPGAVMNARVDAAMAARRAANQTDTRAAMNDALGLNEAKFQAGLIDGAQYAANREAIFNGRVGSLTADMAGRLGEAYSPRTTGLLGMVKGMFSDKQDVDTPYSALNSLITKGYAAPAEDGLGFQATPRAAWDTVTGFFSPVKAALGVVTGNPMMGLAPSPMSMAGGLMNAYGLGRQMDTAGVRAGQGSTSSATSTPADGTPMSDQSTGYTTISQVQTSPSAGIDPFAWFNARRSL